MTKLFTLTEIAKKLGIPRSNADFIIRSRGIPETTRAGITRLYDGAATERIIAEAERVRSRRRG